MDQSNQEQTPAATNNTPSNINPSNTTQSNTNPSNINKNKVAFWVSDETYALLESVILPHYRTDIISQAMRLMIEDFAKGIKDKKATEEFNKKVVVVEPYGAD